MKGKKEEKTITTVKDIRIKLGLTQKQMGEHLGISRTSYSLKENGVRAFKAIEIITICKLAHVDPRTLSL